MKFIDEAIISVQSGNGGRGCVSFRREKFIPRGGPDGGDGGDGGDIVFKASSQKRTLYRFRYQKLFKAKNGGHGQGKQKVGKSSRPLIIEIPVGTIISDQTSGDILNDFLSPGETFLVAKGGRGGQGNKKFTSSTNRAPKFAQPGEPGETVSLKLELKLLADVGIIGLPNAGKSTLISVISSARPKIGNYPFTTLTPNLGVVHTDRGEPFTVADIPGLIKGAHDGAGLGIKFLRHIERTRVLVHLIDASAIEIEDPLSTYKVINKELEAYNKKLAEKPQVVVLNKRDIPDSEDGIQAFQSAFNEENRVTSVSAVTGQNIENLKRQLVTLLDNLNE